MDVKGKILENKNTIRGGLALVILILIFVLSNWMGDKMDTSSYVLVLVAGFCSLSILGVSALAYANEVKTLRRQF